MTQQASSSIVIGADPASIMAVIADFDAYPQWSGYIKKAEVLETAANGRADRVRLVLDAGIVKDDYTLGYDWNGDESVTWRLLSGRALKRMDGSYTLVDAAGTMSDVAGSPTTTDVRYALAVDLAIPMPGLLKRKAEKVIMDTALKELKKRVEG